MTMNSQGGAFRRSHSNSKMSNLSEANECQWTSCSAEWEQCVPVYTSQKIKYTVGRPASRSGKRKWRAVQKTDE